ncbi:hypothetical protein NPIL_249471 [Nephila pilipes]|uniref:Uncharacterized protein n=1 Tax=Nephila pilipes TaxID=299642 RepID=A0A8X6MMP3_NEPPI|nr:hypothetical protein NPIL_249471 [Nephila pilipes]
MIIRDVGVIYSCENILQFRFESFNLESLKPSSYTSNNVSLHLTYGKLPQNLCRVRLRYKFHVTLKSLHEELIRSKKVSVELRPATFFELESSRFCVAVCPHDRKRSICSS